ncbi:MAG: penicillin acylase family protein, partial [Pseudomonadota bacterium]
RSGGRGSAARARGLGVSQAKNWQQMRHALKDFSLPGQNFVFATQGNDIGQLSGTWVGQKANKMPDHLFVTPRKSDQFWKKISKVDKLPMQINPPNGIIVSANDRPQKTAQQARVGWFFPANDRLRRLHQLIDIKSKISLEDIKRFQRDTYSVSHKKLYDFIMKKAGKIALSTQALIALEALKNWNGHFDVDSRKAYLYHVFMAELKERLDKALPIRKTTSSLFRSTGFVPSFIQKDLNQMKADQQNEIIDKALNALKERLQDGKKWGDIHRLRVKHMLANIPVIGKRYEKESIALAGHNETVFKTYGQIKKNRHQVYYGSQSRHISDLSDINANYFVIFGGQDGIINAESSYDQIELWKRKQLPIGKCRNCPAHLPTKLSRIWMK